MSNKLNHLQMEEQEIDRLRAASEYAAITEGEMARNELIDHLAGLLGLHFEEAKTLVASYSYEQIEAEISVMECAR